MDARTQRMKEYFENRRNEIMRKNTVLYSPQPPMTLPIDILSPDTWELAEELFKNEKKGTVLIATKNYGSTFYDFLLSRHPFHGSWYRSIVKSVEILKISNVLQLIDGRENFLIELKNKHEMSKYESHFSEIINGIFNNIEI